MPVKLQRKVAISMKANVVTIEMSFPDIYSAIVYHDDIVERLTSGEGAAIIINVQPVTEKGQDVTDEKFEEHLRKLRKLAEEKASFYDGVATEPMTDFQRHHIVTYLYGTMVESYGKGVQDGVANRLKRINEREKEEREREK